MNRFFRVTFIAGLLVIAWFHFGAILLNYDNSTEIQKVHVLQQCNIELEIDSVIHQLRNSYHPMINGPVSWDKMPHNILHDFKQEYSDCYRFNQNVQVGDRNIRDDRSSKSKLPNIPLYLRDYVYMNDESSYVEWDLEGIHVGIELAKTKSDKSGPEVYPHSSRQHFDILSKYSTIISEKHVLGIVIFSLLLEA